MSPVIAVIALGAMVAALRKRCALHAAPAKLQKIALMDENGGNHCDHRQRQASRTV